MLQMHFENYKKIFMHEGKIGIHGNKRSDHFKERSESSANDWNEVEDDSYVVLNEKFTTKESARNACTKLSPQATLPGFRDIQMFLRFVDHLKQKGVAQNVLVDGDRVDNSFVITDEAGNKCKQIVSWNDDQPDLGIGQDCLILLNGNEKVNDIPCSIIEVVVCQKRKNSRCSRSTVTTSVTTIQQSYPSNLTLEWQREETANEEEEQQTVTQNLQATTSLEGMLETVPEIYTTVFKKIETLHTQDTIVVSTTVAAKSQQKSALAAMAQAAQAIGCTTFAGVMGATIVIHVSSRSINKFQLTEEIALLIAHLEILIVSSQECGIRQQLCTLTGLTVDFLFITAMLVSTLEAFNLSQILTNAQTRKVFIKPVVAVVLAIAAAAVIFSVSLTQELISTRYRMSYWDTWNGPHAVAVLIPLAMGAWTSIFLAEYGIKNYENRLPLSAVGLDRKQIGLSLISMLLLCPLLLLSWTFSGLAVATKNVAWFPFAVICNDLLAISMLYFHIVCNPKALTIARIVGEKMKNFVKRRK